MGLLNNEMLISGFEDVGFQLGRCGTPVRNKDTRRLSEDSDVPARDDVK